VSRGTAASVVATKSLSDSLPELPWLKWQVINARKEFNAKNWRRLSPRRAVERILSYRPTLPVRSTKAAIKAAVASSQEPLPFSTERSFEGEVPETVPLAVPGDSEQTVKLATRRILCVATEWTSGHGGLSTLNRDLCIALASVGHEVACVVRDASVHEIATAAAFKVQVVSCPNYPAAGDADRLFLFNPSVLPEFVPEVVMGHGLISGAPAYHIARSYYGGLPYIHFVHTLPEEIEPYKSRTGKSFFQGAKKADIQFRQCKNAQLVVAIGPRIFREVHTILAASADVRVTQLRPGLNRRLLDNSIDLGKPRSKYCLFMGRLEDADVKGAELACRAIHKVISGWSMGPKPKLIMRGFNSEEEASSIPGLDVVKPYLSIRPYTSDIETIETDIRSSSAIVMPSKREGFGLVALEGISAGIPILVSAESGLAELLLESDVANAIGQPIADLCVVDVDGESDLIIGTWADRLRTILSEPSSFLRANQLRSALRPILTWEKAAALLTADIEIILGSNSRNSSASREI